MARRKPLLVAPPLPGTCTGCGARVFLRGLVWCDEDGTKHECASVAVSETNR